MMKMSITIIVNLIDIYHNNDSDNDTNINTGEGNGIKRSGEYET